MRYIEHQPGTVTELRRSHEGSIKNRSGSSDGPP
jgi:hypothetical protein